MKALRLLGIAVALATFHSHANALFWGEWGALEVFKDLPYANGKVVEAKSRSSSCLMCVTGQKSETAFFSGKNRYDEKDISVKAEKLLSQAIPKSSWVLLGKDFNGNGMFFYPVRIFVPSIEPLIVITIPWKYKANLKDTFASKDIFDESQLFAEVEFHNGKIPNHKRFSLGHYGELDLAKEIRGSLPSVASELRVIMNGFDMQTIIPTDTTEPLSLEIGRQKIQFQRSPEGKIFISFPSN